MALEFITVENLRRNFSVNINDEHRKPKLAGRFYALWFLCWFGVLFLVLGLVLVPMHGPHISTSTAIVLAFCVSVFASSLSTLGYWFAHTFHYEKLQVKGQSDEQK